jgi:nitroreductase
MEFQDVVRKRRMVRSFEPRALPPEVVERVLANAQRAPSARRTAPASPIPGCSRRRC